METITKFIETWIHEHVLDWTILFQGAAALLVFLVSFLLWRRTRPRLAARLAGVLPRGLRDPASVDTACRLVWLSVFAAGLVLVEQSARHLGQDNHLMKGISSLALAWVVIRLASFLIRDRFWSVGLAVVVWGFTALHILGLSAPIVHVMKSIGIDIGGTNLTLYLVLKGGVVFLLVVMAASLLSHAVDHRLKRVPHLTPSHQVLVSKAISILFFCVAFFVAASSAGLNLSTLKIFSGAVGVGVGFGLQKIVSNLISGMILLTDRSIKPGDTIQIDDHFGWITSLNARFVSVTTRDGKEHLIPNEKLITDQVVNWSHTHPKIRLHIPVGVSYESDLKKALELMIQVARQAPRVLEEPEPVCRVMAFGDSGIECEVRVWIQDPVKGVHNVISRILLGIWEVFREHGVVLPYPQRDLWFRNLPQDGPRVDSGPLTGSSGRKTSP